MKWYQHIFGDADSRAKYAQVRKVTRDAEKLKRQQAREDLRLSRSKKELRALTDEELKARIDRLKLEQTYKELATGKTSEVKKGEAYVDGLMQIYGKKVIEGYAGQVGKMKGEQYAKSMKAKMDREAAARKRAKALGKGAAKLAGKAALGTGKLALKGAWAGTKLAAKGVYKGAKAIKEEIKKGVLDYRYEGIAGWEYQSKLGKAVDRVGTSFDDRRQRKESKWLF